MEDENLALLVRNAVEDPRQVPPTKVRVGCASFRSHRPEVGSEGVRSRHVLAATPEVSEAYPRGDSIRERGERSLAAVPLQGAQNLDERLLCDVVDVAIAAAQVADEVPDPREELPQDLRGRLPVAMGSARHPRVDVGRRRSLPLPGRDAHGPTGRHAIDLHRQEHRHLPPRFEDASRVLLDSLAPPLSTPALSGMEPFRYLPHVYFVAKYGLDDFDTSMRLQYELTKRFTAEFSIRAFLVRYPEATLDRLHTWASDPDVHVRRLVSEGTRPRLPWAARLRAFQEDPRPVLALLERLKDDPERYVQRSVANNLNDIGKDHPELLVEVCRAWNEGTEDGRRWIVRHALRSLVKKGHPAALDLLGVGRAAHVKVSEVRMLPAVPRVGKSLTFRFSLESLTKEHQEILVDYAVHFVKANGTTRPKVFKLKRLGLRAGETVELRGRISFRPMTTRTPYPGPHRIELLLNGAVHPLASFDLRP